MILGRTKLWTGALSVVTSAVVLVLAGCGGSTQSQPDPVAYVISGIDLVPDLIAGLPDIHTMPQNPSDPRDNVVILMQRIYFPCNSPSELQYTTATWAGVGVGTKHYKISGQPTNVSINEQTGLVSMRPGADCVPGEYTPTQFIDAESNHKIARSNMMQVRVIMYTTAQFIDAESNHG